MIEVNLKVYKYQKAEALLPSRAHRRGVPGPRRELLVGLFLLVLVPAGALAVQLAQVADPHGCPSRLVPSPGPIAMRLFLEREAQAGALDLEALQAYLTDRLGRAVEVSGLERAGPPGFRLAAALRPFSREILVFLSYGGPFVDVPTASGQVGALGFAEHGGACAYVAFAPRPAQPCEVRGRELGLQPAYAYLAHEVGHLLGLGHAPGGIMGKGVYRLCDADLLSPGEQARVRAWGGA